MCVTCSLCVFPSKINQDNTEINEMSASFKCVNPSRMHAVFDKIQSFIESGRNLDGQSWCPDVLFRMPF